MRGYQTSPLLTFAMGPQQIRDPSFPVIGNFFDDLGALRIPLTCTLMKLAGGTA
jgi:hypothetical protein